MFVRMARCARRLQELVRIFLELRQTVMAAKKISLPVVDVASRGVVWLHFHAADWINHYATSLPCLAMSRLPGDLLLRYTGSPAG